MLRKLPAILAAVVMLSASVSASWAEEIVLKAGNARTSRQGRITVKFVSVIEDSRCPEDAQCIWAGNAKVKLVLSKGKRNRTVELNSMLDPKSITFEGYDIAMVDLTRHRAGERGPARSQTLTVSVTKKK